MWAPTMLEEGGHIATVLKSVIMLYVLRSLEILLPAYKSIQFHISEGYIKQPTFFCGRAKMASKCILVGYFHLE